MARQTWLRPQTRAVRVSAAVAKRLMDVLHDDGEAISSHERQRRVAEFSLDVTLARFTDVYDMLLTRLCP